MVHGRLMMRGSLQVQGNEYTPSLLRFLIFSQERGRNFGDLVLDMQYQVSVACFACLYAHWCFFQPDEACETVNVQ
jgi:hypothetical protein